MTRGSRRAPSTLIGWAAPAVCAFVGGILAPDATITGATWLAVAFVLLLASLERTFRVRAEYDAVTREVNRERAALAAGRRAPHITLIVREQDGTVYVRTLAQILTDTTPEGHDMIWEAPASAVLWYATGGPTDG